MKRRGGTFLAGVGTLMALAGCAAQGTSGFATPPVAAAVSDTAAAQDLPRDERTVARAALNAATSSPAATPTAAPVAPAAPPRTASVVTAPVPAVRVAASGPRHDWVEVPSVGISVAVGTYSDCSGQTALTRATAARDTCVPSSEVFLVGHRPGVFAALPGATAGALVNYWDGAGTLHSYRVYQVSMVPKSDGGNVMTNQHPALLMQTCDDGTGSYYYFYGSPA